MNTQLNDFIFEIAEFNDCTFCKKFGFQKSCPIKHAYDGFEESGKEPSSEYISKCAGQCKAHITESLRTIL